jgi:hypothetical protein
MSTEQLNEYYFFFNIKIVYDAWENDDMKTRRSVNPKKFKANVAVSDISLMELVESIRWETYYRMFLVSSVYKS